MKKIIILTIVLFYNLIAISQINTINLSLKEAISLGLKNRHDVQAGHYTLINSENNVIKRKKEWLPDISASANIRYSSSLQGNLVPAGFGGFQEPKIIAFGANNSSVFSLDLVQSIYNPEIITNIKIAKMDQQAEVENQLILENSVKAIIAEAYYNLLLKQIQLSVLKEIKNRFTEYLTIAEEKYKSGVLLETEYLKAKLNYNNANIEEEKAAQNYLLSVEYLKYQINLSKESEIILTDSLTANDLSTNIEEKTSLRPEIKLLNIQQESNKLLLKRNRQSALPTITLFANYSTQFLYTNFDYSKSEYWNPFNFVGIKILLPISSNIKYSNNIKEFQIKIKKGDLELKQKTRDINFEIVKTKTEYENMQHTVKVHKANYDLAKTIYETKKKQFEKGVFTYSNLLDTEQSIHNSELNYIKSIYDYYCVKINLTKATYNFN